LSLTPDFFQHRAAEEEAWRKKGYTPLETLLQQHAVTEAQLRQAGVLTDRAIASSTDIEEYILTPTGKMFFTPMKRYQLTLLKPGKRQTANATRLPCTTGGAVAPCRSSTG
jgi:hypothetical protein